MGKSERRKENELNKTRLLHSSISRGKGERRMRNLTSAAEQLQFNH